MDEVTFGRLPLAAALWLPYREVACTVSVNSFARYILFDQVSYEIPFIACTQSASSQM